MKRCKMSLITKRITTRGVKADESPMQEACILRYIQRISEKDYFVKLIETTNNVEYFDIILSYCGEELFKYITGPMKETEMENIVYQLVDITKELQRIGISHLDLSLDNFCIDSHGVVRLIDFGLAAVHPLYFPEEFEKCVEWNTRVQIVDVKDPEFKCYGISIRSGKQAYMPPEVYYNSSYFDAFQYDLFSLGVCLYSLITKNLAFEKHGDDWYKLIISGKWLHLERFKKYPKHLLEIVDNLLKMENRRQLIDNRDSGS